MRTGQTAHRDHSLISIQYRPLSAPTIDGSELTLLQRFQRVTTEKEFYLYFPFFFSNFEGFKEERDSNVTQFLAAIDTSPNVDTENVRQLREALEQSSVDSFIRTCGQGDFRPLLAQIQPMLQDRIHEVQISNQIFKFYNRLHELVEIFKEKYNGQDVPHPNDPSVLAFARSESRNGTNPYWSYVLYSLGLELPTFNSQVNLDGLIPLLLQENAAGDRKENLSPALRVLKIFETTYQDSPGFSQLIHYIFGGLMKPVDVYLIVCPPLN